MNSFVSEVIVRSLIGFKHDPSSKFWINKDAKAYKELGRPLGELKERKKKRFFIRIYNDF